MRNALTTIAAVLTLSTAAYAAEAPMAGVQPIAATNGERVVCHYTTHDGVLIRRPICKTTSEWARARRSAQDDFSTYQKRTYTIPFGK